MKLIITLCLICTFHFVGYTHLNTGTLAYADSLADAGATSRAFVEYERVCFNAFDNVERTEALLAKARLYAKYGNSKDALRTTKRIALFGLADSMIHLTHYESATYAFVNLEFEAAESELLQIELMLPENFAIQSSPLHAMVLNQLGRWDEAKSKLSLYIDQSESLAHLDSVKKDSVMAIVEELYQSNKQPKFKDPKKALILSTFLPGSGQLWTGHPFDAAFSVLAILTGFGGMAYGILIAKYYVSSVVAGIVWFQRFYGANQKRSEYLANRRNYRKRLKYNEKLSNFIYALP